MNRLIHHYLVERCDYNDGDTNSIWGFVYMELLWPPQIGIDWWKNDGLPIRRLKLWLIAVGWGQTHEWFCQNSLEDQGA